MSATLDSLIYGKEDYEQMRAGLLQDSLFMEMTDKGIARGDDDAIRFKKMLQMPYEQRFKEAGVTEYDVKLAIFSFRAMREVKRKFGAIDSALSKYRETGIIDSILETEPRLDSILKGYRGD
jgi:hypothetical protein